VAGLTDELLMAFADRALDEETQTRIEALLRIDPEARARVAAFRATGREGIGRHYDPVLDEPVPDRLIEFVMTHGKGIAAGPARPRRQRLRPLELLARWRGKLVPQGAAWHLAAASAAALIVGAGLGYVLRGDRVEVVSGPTLAALKNGQISAEGALRHVLETMPSGLEARAAGGLRDSAVVRASLTFKTKQGNYCREYEIATAAEGRFTGLACRDSRGNWALQVHVPEADKGQGTKFVPVAGPREVALDAIVDRIMAGDALGRGEEDAAIARGWK
jgi:AcrR family transcriptional regulator